MYLSDKQRVEISLPAQLMYAVFIAGINEDIQQGDDFKRLRFDLVDAIREPTNDLKSNKALSVLRRTNTISKTVMDMITHDNIEVGKAGLIIFHVLRFIIEDDYFHYQTDSAIGRCLVVYMEALDHHAQIPERNQSAIKQAVKLLHWLQSQGYYVGVRTSL